MPKELVVLNEEQRRQADHHYNDICGWEFAQAMVNRTVRGTMRDVAHAIETALANPDDADCARLLDAMRQLVGSKP